MTALDLSVLTCRNCGVLASFCPCTRPDVDVAAAVERVEKFLALRNVMSGIDHENISIVEGQFALKSSDLRLVLDALKALTRERDEA